MHTITPDCCVAAGAVVTGVKYQLKAAVLKTTTECSSHPSSQEGRPSVQLHSFCLSYFCHVLEYSQKGLCLTSVMVWNGHGAITTTMATYPSGAQPSSAAGLVGGGGGGLVGKLCLQGGKAT